MHCALAAKFNCFLSPGRRSCGFLSPTGSFLLGGSQLSYTGDKATEGSAPGFTFV
jgi:hypothetical protein